MRLNKAIYYRKNAIYIKLYNRNHTIPGIRNMVIEITDQEKSILNEKINNLIEITSIKNHRK